METIDVKGLPEPVSRALQTVVEALRDQVRNEAEENGAKAKKAVKDLPVWPGTVIGPLRREEIYEDVG